ncbi:MAG TPA: MMPL family transporter [Candidatus Limnocylindria bacterium]|nr:MMPL family transporter [Candidatus Limnocylindria bacterium]
MTRAPLTVRIAAWSARHRWLVVALWFAATLGTLGASAAAGGIRAIDVDEDPNGPRLESEIAYEVLGAGEPVAPAERLVIVVGADPGVALDPVFQAQVHAIAAEMTAAKATVDGIETQVFDSVIDPFALPPEAAAGVISPDGSTVQVVGNIPGEAGIVEQKLGPVPAIVEAVRSRLPDARIHVISSTFLNRDFNHLIAEELDSSLLLTIPLTFVILLLAFGAIVAALVPLVLAATALAAGYGLLGLYSQSVGPVSANAAQLLILMGLAVAVDYSLFMVTRFRSERQRGAAVLDAIETSSSTAGRAVFFSGVAVVISLGGLLTLGISLFTSMAVGTMGVVLVAVIGSLTFLPATLAIVGDRVNLGRPATWLPRLMRRAPVATMRRGGTSAMDALERRAAQPPGSGFWARLVNAVMRRPVLLTLLSAGLLLAVASPALNLRTGTTGLTALPSTIDGIAGIKLVNEKFPFGQEIRLDVVVTQPARPDVAAAIEDLKVRVAALPGMGAGTTARVAEDGHAALVTFQMSGDRNDEANRANVREVREVIRPAVVGAPGFADVEVYVAGQAARTMDIVEIYAEATPRIFAFVLGLSFVLMLIAFRSIVIPIKAILLNLLSTAAAFGVLVLVFHEGWFAEQLGITPGGVIESWVPIFIFTILFGLSMDYHLFILTRIKEARDRGLDSRAAVARGISVTSGTITSAASIMVVVFAVFVTFKFVFIQQLGVGLAVAVFIDVTLIRSFLLPASMTLLGDWNWWLPRWLGWLPRVSIEGVGAEPEVAG